MNKKKISVIVPAYNIEPYLGRCLDSLLAQSYPELEIIVTDDGSTDSTGALLDRYAAEHPQIIAIHQKNGGVTSARLAALKRAGGDYIGFVDGDDLTEPGMFETLIGDAEQYGAEIAHCGYPMVFPNGRIDRYYGTGRIVDQNGETGVLDLLRGDFVEPGLCNKLYRRELIEQFLAEDRMDWTIRINEDLLMNFLLFSRAKKAVFRDECLYHYMLRKGSASKAEIQPYKLLDPQRVLHRIWTATEGREQLHQAAYQRYVRVLIANAAQRACPEVSRQARAELKRLSVQEEHKRLPRKEQYMALGAAELLPLYRLVRWCYDRATGNYRKYDVE